MPGGKQDVGSLDENHDGLAMHGQPIGAGADAVVLSVLAALAEPDGRYLECGFGDWGLLSENRTQ